VKRLAALRAAELVVVTDRDDVVTAALQLFERRVRKMEPRNDTYA